MADMRKGIIGGFTGKLGDVVGYYRNGVLLYRNAPKKKNRPISPAQRIHRERFSLMAKFLSPLAPFINEIHRLSTSRRTGYPKISSLNHKQAIKGEYPDFEIDYPALRITLGHLRAPVRPMISNVGKGFLDIHWICGDIGDFISCNDRLWLVIYDEGKKSWEIFLDAASRIDEKLRMDLKNHLTNRLQVYGGFKSLDGKRISDSQYLGSIHVL